MQLSGCKNSTQDNDRNVTSYFELEALAGTENNYIPCIVGDKTNSQLSNTTAIYCGDCYAAYLYAKGRGECRRY